MSFRPKVQTRDIPAETVTSGLRWAVENMTGSRVRFRELSLGLRQLSTHSRNYSDAVTKRVISLGKQNGLIHSRHTQEGTYYDIG